MDKLSRKWTQEDADQAATIAALTAERDTLAGRVAALTETIEACDQKMTRFSADGETDGPFVTMYQVLAGPWHRVLAVARGAALVRPPAAEEDTP